ncbi:MAG: S1C family serine protease [Nitrospiraceae bacterium]
MRSRGPVRIGATVLLTLTVVVILLVPFPARADPLSHQLATAIDRAKRATVGILDDAHDPRVPDRPARLAIRGTGFHMRDGYIVTARHAVEQDQAGKKIVPPSIAVMTSDLQELPAQLIGGSAYLDIVLYRVRNEHQSALSAATPLAEHGISPGEEVFTIGYPLGWGPAAAFGRIGNDSIFLQTVETRLLQADLAVCSGNSGGGLYNVSGEVVGVMHAIIQTEQIQSERRCSRFAFAVPGRVAHRIITALVEGKHPSFSKLGIHMTAVKLGTRWRVAARDVLEPARAGGVQRGDVLLAIDGAEITDAAQLKNYLIERTTPGQEVKLRVLRGDREIELTVMLAET